MALGDAPGIIPVRWTMPKMPIKYDQQIIVNWLAVEVPQTVPVPIVDRLSHWRNHEVYWFVRNYDWTERLCH